jgi:ferredoxin
MSFEKVRAVRDERGRRQLVPTGEPEQVFECDDVLVAVGQENAFPWIERDLGLTFDEWGMPTLDATTLQSSLPKVFFGGDAALGPKNIIWAVAHGHAAAISIDKFLHGEDPKQRPRDGMTLVSQKMGIHEWTYDNAVTPDLRNKVPWRDVNQTLKNIKVEVELGFDVQTAWREAQRCLNCDVQTVFTTSQCIECDACVDICPTDCITFTGNAPEDALRTQLRAPTLHADQALYVSSDLKTGRVMVKDEDVCLHCGLCAERCPTGAWDMQRFNLQQPRAGHACRSAKAGIGRPALAALK